MHTVDLLEHTLRVAAEAGYQVRHEWLGGSGGGGCELKGRKLLFVDIALPPAEQLDQVIQTLRGDPAVAGLPTTPELARTLAPRKCA